MDSQNKGSMILKLIEKLTTTGKRHLDDDLMKQLKRICKTSDECVKQAYHALMTQLRKNHSEIRLSAVLVINELFMRSSTFRKLLEFDVQEFLELVVEIDLDKPLPLPNSAAKELKLKGLKFIKDWCSKFGEKYVRFGLALTYLKKCKKVDFDDMEARSAAERARQRQEQERQDRIMNERMQKVQNEINEIAEEISNIHTQMENCFRLLIPHPVDLFTPLDFEASQQETTSREKNGCNESDGKAGEIKASTAESYVVGPESDLREHGFYNMKETITVEITNNSEVTVVENEDTLPVIENLNDLHRQISTRYFPIVSRWLKVLTKATNCTDVLKKALDLKHLLEASLEKYRELKIQPDNSTNVDDDDDDEFEEVKEKEGYEDVAHEELNVSLEPITKPSCSKELSTAEKAYLWKLNHHKDDIKDPTSALSNLNKILQKYKPSEISKVTGGSSKQEQKQSHKAELLERAPVLPYDIDLYHWEEEKPLIPERVKFDSLHKFWETKDDDDEENDILKKVQLASLRTRKIDFSGKFEPVKWSCRAPLSNGKLCPRKDRYKCPFHGKIVKRDSLGNPVDYSGNVLDSSTQVAEKNLTATVPDWQDPELLRDIEVATGINLKVPEKKVKGVKRKKKEKDGGLTDIKKINNNTRERLTKKIMKRYGHCARKLDEMEKKRFDDKFGDQWNYY